jgi:hypothetical protein
MDRRRFLSFAGTAAFAAGLPHQRLLAAAEQALSQPPSTVDAVTGSGRRINLTVAEVKELADSLAGQLLLPGMEGYETARRVLNYSIDKHPALIARCTGAADVQYAVAFARSHDLLTAVKCGGHSFSGKSTCDSGLLIDLSMLRGVRVDPAAATARVAGGSLLGQMDHEAMAFNLVTTAGTVSHTGIGGLTLGGGFGRLGRRFGLTLDNVLGVDIVTADGRIQRADAQQNPDLYWAVRGGGGNFGVVTSFQMQLHPMQREVIGGDMLFPLARAREILQFYAEFTADAPDTLYMDCALMTPPGGKPGFLMLHVCYSGPPKQMAAVLAPLRKLGKPMVDGVKPVDYVALQRSWDNTDPRSNGEYQKSGFIPELSAELINDVVDGYQGHPARATTMFFQHSGGAIGQVAEDATAFAHRNSSHNMFASAGWPIQDDATPHMNWLRGYWKNLERYTSGFYTNDIADESQQLVDKNYGRNYPRLVQVKNTYDPTNLFRLNANVVPSA